MSDGSAPAPPLRQLYSALGEGLLARNRNLEASQIFEQALREEGESPSASTLRFNLATAYQRSGQLRPAFRTYLEAILASPAQMHKILPYAHALLTPETAYAEGDWLETQCQVGWSELPPQQRADAAMFLGRATLYRGEFGKALKFFQDAVAANSDDPYAREGLGEALSRTGDLRQSAIVLADARNLALAQGLSERVTAIDAKLADVLVASGKYEEALSKVQNSLRMEERHAYQFLLARGQSYLALGEPEKALEAVNTADGIAKTGTVKLLLLRAQVFTALKRYSEAVTVADQVLQNDSFNYDAVLCKAEALIEGQLDPAQGRSLLKVYSEHSGASTQIESLPLFQKSHELDGRFQYFLAELYYAFGRRDESLLAVNRALELGLGDGNNPEAPVQRLKGELLENRDDAENAAQCFYLAGRAFYWRGDFFSACEQLQRAAALKQEQVSIYWYWSDALRMRAYQLAPPSGDPDTLNDALNVWNDATKITLPDAEYSWAYITRALLAEQMAGSTSEGPAGFLWEAAVFCERAILLNSDEPVRWICLSRYHRFLGNEATAIQASERAADLAPDNPQAMEERALALATAGEFAPALKWIDSGRAAQPNLFADGIKAFILMYVRDPLDEAAPDPVTSGDPTPPGDYEAALNLTNPAVKANPDQIWIRHLRALSYLILSKSAEGAQELEWIWQHYNSGDKGNLAAFTSAAYLLGKLDEAIGLCELRLSVDPDDAGAYYHLGLSYLAREDVARGEKNFMEAIDRAKRRLLIDMFVFGFRSLEQFAPQWTRGVEIRAALDRIRENARKRYVEYATPSVEDELKSILVKPQPAGQSMIGVCAGLARLYTAQERWSEAAQNYERLRQQFDFLEAVEGLQIVSRRMTAKADLLLSDGKSAEAAQLLSQALTILLPSMAQHLQSRADLYARISYVSFLQSDRDGLRANFVSALALYRALGISEPGDSLGSVCLPLLKDSASYWGLEEELNYCESESSADKILQRDLATARKKLANYLQPIYPLTLEIGRSLLPPKSIWVKGTSPGELHQRWPLTAIHLPKMRDRIRAEMGVEIPGALVRDDLTLPDDGYRIRINEVAVAEGDIQSGQLYSPASPATLSRLGIDEKAIVVAPHPVTQQLGCWIGPEYWPAVVQAGLELWESPDVYAVWHMEAIARRNLAEFVGIQETEALLRANNLLSHMPDAGSRIRLARVLRALVSDQTPITNFAEIVEAFVQSDVNDGDIESIATAVKLRLKTQLQYSAEGPNARSAA